MLGVKRKTEPVNLTEGKESQAASRRAGQGWEGHGSKETRLRERRKEEAGRGPRGSKRCS